MCEKMSEVTKTMQYEIIMNSNLPNLEVFTKTIEKYTRRNFGGEKPNKEEMYYGLGNTSGVGNTLGRFLEDESKYEFNLQDGGTWSEGGEDSLWLLRFPNDFSNELKFTDSVSVIDKSLVDLKKSLEELYESVSVDVGYNNCEEKEKPPHYIIHVRLSFRHQKFNRNSLLEAIRIRDKRIADEIARKKAEEDAEIARKKAEEDVEIARKKAEEDAEIARKKAIKDNYEKFKDFVINEIGDFELKVLGEQQELVWKPIKSLVEWFDDDFGYAIVRTNITNNGFAFLIDWLVKHGVREPHSI
jgi:hypothetical protein